MESEDVDTKKKNLEKLKKNIVTYCCAKEFDASIFPEFLNHLCEHKVSSINSCYDQDEIIQCIESLPEIRESILKIILGYLNTHSMSIKLLKILYESINKINKLFVVFGGISTLQVILSRLNYIETLDK